MKQLFLYLGFFLVALSSNALTLEKEVEEKIEFPPVVSIVPPTYICYKTPGDISIDGDLSEWKDVPRLSDYVDLQGSRSSAPKYKIYTKMVYDTKGLYIATVLEEPHIWSYFTEHNSRICMENAFEVFIDLLGNTHNYFEYEINALGTDWDLFLDKPYRDGPVILTDWEFLGKKTAVVVDGTVNDPSDNDKSWTVELFIPWKSINQVQFTRVGPPKVGEQIRMNFVRVNWKTNIIDGKYVRSTISTEESPRINYSVWATAGEVNMHVPETWGYVQFSDKVAGSGIDVFHQKPEEKTKWVLRQLYFRQMEYKKIKGQFADSAAALQALDFCNQKEYSQLKVERTTSLFEISLPSEIGEVWRINNEGLVWK